MWCDPFTLMYASAVYLSNIIVKGFAKELLSWLLHSWGSVGTPAVVGEMTWFNGKRRERTSMKYETIYINLFIKMVLKLQISSLSTILYPETIFLSQYLRRASLRIHGNVCEYNCRAIVFCQRLTPQDIQYQWNENRLYHDDVIKLKHFRVTGPLCGEFTGHRSLWHYGNARIHVDQKRDPDDPDEIDGSPSQKPVKL